MLEKELSAMTDVRDMRVLEEYDQKSAVRTYATLTGDNLVPPRSLFLKFSPAVCPPWDRCK